jgi:hypothetical protein
MRQLFPPLPQQVLQDPLLQVQQVVRPLGEVPVPQLLQRAGMLPQHPAHRKFGRKTVLADQPLNLAPQLGVLRQLPMRGENRPVLPPQPGRRQGLVRLQVGNHRLQRPMQPLHLAVDNIHRDQALRNPKAFGSQHHGWPNRHTG